MAKAKGFLRLTPEEQLAELDQELKRGRAYEASLRSEKLVVHGIQDGEAIFVDPRAAVLEVVIHELLHRRQPKLSERTVDKTARHLVACMSEAEKSRWWQLWSRAKRKAPPVDVDDD